MEIHGSVGYGRRLESEPEVWKAIRYEPPSSVKVGGAVTLQQGEPLRPSIGPQYCKRITSSANRRPSFLGVDQTYEGLAGRHDGKC